MTGAGEGAARQLRSDHNIVGPVESLRILIQNMPDVELVERAITEGFDGAYAPDSQLKRGFILINSKPNWLRRRFTMAHELGHHLLGHQGRVDKIAGEGSSDRNEIEANAFAAELLTPRALLVDHPPVHGIADIIHLAAYFMVSGRSMIVRLSSLSIITARQRKEIEATYDASAFTAAMPIETPDRPDTAATTFPKTYVDSVHRVYAENGMTLEAAAEALDISLSEAEDLLPNPIKNDERLLIRQANSGRFGLHRDPGRV